MRMGVAKLRREGRRLRDQAASALRYPFDRWVQARHDRDFARRVRVTAGVRPPGRRIAVYLLYQPGGIAASTLLTCEHLAAQGYAVLAVSNAPVMGAGPGASSPRAAG